MFNSPEHLLDYLHLCASEAPYELYAPQMHSFKVPQSFARRINKGDWFDPLLLQILPRAQELNSHPGFCTDPLGEKAAEEIPGYLHKYQGRALLLCTQECALHCRYCFRRSRGAKPPFDLDLAIRYLSASPEIHEVILSGGDPFSLAPSELAPILNTLAALEHISTIRIHTRAAVAMPQILTPALCSILSQTAARVTLVIVLHINHAQEIDESVESMCLKLRTCGALLLNQSVLLAQVNDSAPVLQSLSLRLLSCGILPYYLHNLDKVSGTAHFEVSQARGRKIMSELRALLPGYLVPRFVQEIAGQKSKIPIFD